MLRMFSALQRLTSGSMIGLLLLVGSARADSELGPGDHRLAYRSAIDDTDQPYRLYVPTIYDARTPLPLIVAMHGTGGNQDTLFDEYQEAPHKDAAEKHGVLLVSPLGRGTTEYRGIGENDVLCVIQDVQQRLAVDADRIYLTGHSMGGTGAAYLALHHPDQFAAIAPLAAAYSFPWLARSGTQLPQLWIGGALDADFYHRGVAVGVERMRKFGVPVLSESLPEEGHGGPPKQIDRVFGWLLKHKRTAHPTSYFFEADTPLHGRAWWTSIERMVEPGRMASVQATADANVARLVLVNVAELLFAPDPAVFNYNAPIALVIDGQEMFRGTLSEMQLVRARRSEAGQWQASVESTGALKSPTNYRQHPVAEAPEQLDMAGTVEKRLANWITDAMREATGADIALYNPVFYRGLPIPQGSVDVVDLVQCSRPFDQYLVTVRLQGREILEILDANLDPQRDVKSTIDSPGSGRMVQISGARYVFDRQRPAGQRIVDTDIQPERIYTVACEGQVVERETMLLAGRFMRLDYHTTDVPFTLALYGHAARTGRIEASLEGRVREMSPGTR